MSGKPTKHDQSNARLERLPAAERGAALRHAIPAAAPNEVPALVLTLLEAASAPTHTGPTHGGPLGRIRGILAGPARRASDEALVSLACVWKRVPSELKGAALAVGRGRWTVTIERAAASSSPFERESAAILIRDSSNATSAREACKLLCDEDRDVARAADKALLSLAVRVAGISAERLGPDLSMVPIPTRPSPEPRDVVVEYVAKAAWEFGGTHRGRDVLRAALLLADLSTPPALLSGPYRRLEALLTTPDHPAIGSLRTLIRTSRSPEIRARCLRWISGGPLADAALERLATSDSDTDHEALLAGAHLVLRPNRAAMLRDAKVRLAPSAAGLAKSGLLPEAKAWARLAPEERRAYAFLGGTLDLPRPIRRAALAPCLGDPDTHARIRAVHGCDPMDLADFTFDGDPRVARSAALRWSCVGLTDSIRTPRHAGDDRRSRVLAKLERSAHGVVRAIAAADAQRTNAWDPSSPVSRVVARRWNQEDPSGFLAAARAELRSNDVDTRVRTIQQCAAVGNASALEPELITLLADESHPRVAATAARALGAVRTPRARDGLTKALRASDARLRANALESLARSSREALGVLIEFKSDRHHRVRGAAVRAEIDSNAAGTMEDVCAMLDDSRSEHRVAGLWVTERALTGRRGMPPTPEMDAVLDRLSEIARADTSESIRARALRCVRRVLLESPPGPAAEPIASSQIEPAPPRMLEVSG